MISHLVIELLPPTVILVNRGNMRSGKKWNKCLGGGWWWWRRSRSWRSVAGHFLFNPLCSQVWPRFSWYGDRGEARKLDCLGKGGGEGWFVCLRVYILIPLSVMYCTSRMSPAAEWYWSLRCLVLVMGRLNGSRNDVALRKGFVLCVWGWAPMFLSCFPFYSGRTVKYQSCRL